jgi:methionine sulfoxide reductase heme-binding subunit
MLVASTTAWYAARAGGMVAFALLTVGVLLGLALSGRARLKDWPRFALEDVHRFVGLLAGTFVAIHVGVLLFQSYVPFSLTDLVIPFAASWKPLPTAIGVIAMELMVALALTNRYRRELPYVFWRRAHYANFAVWAFALVHGIASGTDTSTAWGAATYALAGGAVAGMTVWRVASRRALEPWALRLWPGTAALVTAELLVAVALVR